MLASVATELIAREFKIVKSDVGNFGRNLDLVATYGNSIKEGIPTAIVLSPSNKVCYMPLTVAS
jgi:protein disulfide-isomerase